jgi:thymidylate kinase
MALGARIFPQASADGCGFLVGHHANWHVDAAGESFPEGSCVVTEVIDALSGSTWRTIVVEGCFGAGKSTLLREISKRMREELAHVPESMLPSPVLDNHDLGQVRFIIQDCLKSRATTEGVTDGRRVGVEHYFLGTLAYQLAIHNSSLEHFLDMYRELVRAGLISIPDLTVFLKRDSELLGEVQQERRTSINKCFLAKLQASYQELLTDDRVRAIAPNMVVVDNSPAGFRFLAGGHFVH